MVNFFVCDDNENFLNKINNIVNNYMMKNDYDFKVNLYKKIDDKLKNDSSRIKGFKIYILDIEIEEESGLEFSRIIREEQGDWNSIIVLITAHNELKYEALGKRLYIFDFISKYDGYTKILNDDLDKIIKVYENRERKLIYKDERIIKILDFQDITLIEKEKNSNKVKIYTESKTIEIGESISSIYKRLDNRFIKLNRSIIVNKDKICEYNLEEGTVLLKNSKKIYDLSKKLRKNL